MAVRARKRFGQHFLISSEIIHAIIQAIAPQADDLMVEIGPGLGALTLPLLRTVKELCLIEIDLDLIQKLQLLLQQYTIHFYSADVLQFDFAALFNQNNAHNAHFKPRCLRIVGNLPYNISTPLLFHLLNYSPLIQDQHFMLQKEVVDRMVAVPKTKAYGRLSVMLQAYYQIEKLFEVAANAFKPLPAVNSAVVRLQPIEHRLFLSDQHRVVFAQLVKDAFSQRRKQLKHLLAAYPLKVFQQLAFDLTRRAEEVTVEEYIRIANQILLVPSSA